MTTAEARPMPSPAAPVEAAPTLSAQLEQALADVAGRRFEPKDFGELERLAERAHKSRLFKVESAEAALCIMLTGASLGLSPIIALRCIHIVEGRPQLSSDLIAAVILRSGLAVRWEVVETTAERCVIETERRGQPGTRRHEWTRAMAERAGLWGRNTWSKYPGAMLRARTTAELGRIVYPDVLAGVYVEGELGDDQEPAAPAEATTRASESESPAWTAFRAALAAAALTVWMVWAAYVDLADALRGEGKDPREYLDGPRGGGRLAAGKVRELGLVLSQPETNTLLGARDGGTLAQLLDGVRAVPTKDATAAARWWTEHRGEIARDHEDLVRSALARRVAGSTEPDGQQTKAGKAAIKAALDALAKETPAPAPASQPAPVAAPAPSEPSRDPGEDDDQEEPQAKPVDVLLEAVRGIELPGEGVKVWIEHRDATAALSAADREAVWKALCERVEQVGRMTNAKVWLKKAIAEEDAMRARRGETGPHPDDPPPRGGAPRPAAPTATDATGAPAEGTSAPAPAAIAEVITRHGEVLDTEDAMRAHLGELEHPLAVQASYLRHRAHPVYGRLAAQRYAALVGADEDTARYALESARPRQQRRAA